LHQCSKGLATLHISEDLNEVNSGIIILLCGELMGIVKSDEVTITQLGLMMAGKTEEAVFAP